MQINTSSLLVSLVTGSIGMAYWVYGKKRHKSVMLWSGVALMVYPYFIEGILPSVLVGLALSGVPFFYKD